MVNDEGVPGHPFAVGVMEIRAVSVTVEVFTVRNDGVPAEPPPTARPIEGCEFTQVKVVPATGPLKGTAGITSPLHATMLLIPFTVGVGKTRMW